MNQQIKNIVISGGVSLFVSSITFILGLKSGKNQSDRQLYRNKYRSINVHLTEMLYRLQTTSPKKWEDYKSIQLGSGVTQYSPLLIEMKLNGESIELNKKIINKSEKIELDLLKYSEKYYNQFGQIKEYIVNNLYKCCNSVKKTGNSIRTIDNTIGIPQLGVNYGIIIMKKPLDKILYKLRENEKFSISFTSGQDSSTITIFKNTLTNKTVEQFLLEIYDYFQRNNEDIKNLYQERYLLSKRTEKLIKDVSKRVKEPFSFSETFLGAIIDIFKF